ncbi:hypothetical protein TWF694_001305 [Orbilia ellipsospora]|uniref:Protein kinase domain-containing protein n=1 Tax=Orbilia ellipsospora TaxID=2528407 RepID=A0AAV9XSU0_9PEZI
MSTSPNHEEETQAPVIDLVEIWGGLGDTATIIFDYNSKRICVSFYSTDKSENSKYRFNGILEEDRLIKNVAMAMDSECRTADEPGYTGSPDRECGSIVDDVAYKIINRVVEVGKELFNTIPPIEAPVLNGQITLHSKLYRETIDLVFKTVNGKPSVTKDNRQSTEFADSDSSLRFDNDLPRYSSQEVLVSLQISDESDSYTAKVTINEKPMYCRAAKSISRLSSVGIEISKLQKIRNASSEHIKVPKLLGYVKNALNDDIIGYVQELPPGNRFGYSLGYIKIAEVLRETREKWAAQICQTIDALHKIGVFCFDLNRYDFELDNQDNLWLTQIQRYSRAEQALEDLTSVMARDKLAVKKILKYLEVE